MPSDKDSQERGILTPSHLLETIGFAERAEVLASSEGITHPNATTRYRLHFHLNRFRRSRRVCLSLRYSFRLVETSIHICFASNG